MKKFTVVASLIATFLFSLNSFAQQEAYKKGDKILMAGMNFGTQDFRYKGSQEGGIPVLASLEFGIHESISLGPYIGYVSYKYGYSIYNYRWNFISAGAKGSWHFLSLINREWELNINDDKFDFYVSLYLGYENRSYSGDDFGLNIPKDEGKLIFAPVLGFKYLFLPGIGAFVEMGRGAFRYATVGVSLTF